MESADRIQLTAQYEAMLEIARRHLPQHCPHPEVVVVKTASGAVFFLEIPDYTDAQQREPLENAFLEKLAQNGQNRIEFCLASVNGIHPEIPSWNFRTGLTRLHPDNLQTQTFLWGGEDRINVRSLRELLPPKK